MKRRNYQSHKKIFEAVYGKYLEAAAKRGMISESDAKFWAEANGKLQKNSGYNPFRHLYRTHYRIDQRFNS